MSRLVDSHLAELREQVLRMAGLAEAILEKALNALWRYDTKLAREVREDDRAIDALDVQIDELVLQLFARHAPVADDLRAVFAAKSVAHELERVGDLARNVAKCALRLSAKSKVQPPARLRALGDEAQRMLRHALDSFSENNAELAAEVLREDEQVDEDQDAVIRAAIEDIRSRPECASQEVDFIVIAKHLERVGDHATNIGEAVILAVEARNLKHKKPDEI